MGKYEFSIDDLLHYTRKIESYLEKLGGSGTGMKRKLSSLKIDLPRDVKKDIKDIADIRNKAVHEDNFKLTQDEYLKCERKCQKTIKILKDIYNANNGNGSFVWIVWIIIGSLILWWFFS